MGPFITAHIKINGSNECACSQAETWLSGMRNHIADAGLGHISEIFEGDPPHRPCGCSAQAWSVAEVLRATVEDIYGVRPLSLSLVPAIPAAISEVLPRRAVANE